MQDQLTPTTEVENDLRSELGAEQEAHANDVADLKAQIADRDRSLAAVIAERDALREAPPPAHDAQYVALIAAILYPHVQSVPTAITQAREIIAAAEK